MRRLKTTALGATLGAALVFGPGAVALAQGLVPDVVSAPLEAAPVGEGVATLDAQSELVAEALSGATAALAEEQGGAGPAASARTDVVAPPEGVVLPARPVTLVELFTSQGCVSCPPADAFFEGIVDQPDLIALALHVDYWDYIGWEDSFGSEAFTERQKSYARAIGSRTIYTPQFVINGSNRIEGFDPEEILATLAAPRAEPAVQLQILRLGDTLAIHAVADPPLSEPVRVDVVRYIPEAVVDITRGENAGQTLTYRNIVTAWTPLGDWTGQEFLELKVPVSGPEASVVVVQEHGPGAVLAAAAVQARP